MYMYTKGHSRILSTGVYLPEQRLSSAEVMEQAGSKQRFGLSPNWLEKVTGVRERRVTPAGILPSDMAVMAAREAMEEAGIVAGELDVIIYAGVIRDHMLEPGTAHVVQRKLGADNAVVFDVNNACLGFMSAIHLLDSLIATGQVHRGLIVTGEQGYQYTLKAYDRLRQTDDREEFSRLAAGLTLGDAGAAFIMGPKQDPDTGFMGFIAHSEGRHSELCYCGDARQETPLYTDMAGITREAARMVGLIFHDLMDNRLRWSASQVSKFVTHQAGKSNFRILSKVTDIPVEGIPETVTTLGNIITASVPVILHRLRRSGDVAAGQRLLLSGSGGGISAAQGAMIWDLV